MADPRTPDRDRAFERLLGDSLGRDRTDRGPCPSEDLLAGYYERGLSAAETSRWEVHFADCARCRQQLALLARAAAEVEGAAVRDRGARPPLWASFSSWKWLAPVGAAGTALALWLAVRPSEPVPPALDSKLSSRQAPAVSASPSEQDRPATPEVRARPEAPPPSARSDAFAPPARSPAGDPSLEKRASKDQSPRREAAVAENRAPAPVMASQQAPKAREGQQAGTAPGASVAADRAAAFEAAAERTRSETKEARAPDGRVRWRVGPAGLISRSEDAGATWQIQSSGVDTDLQAVSAPAERTCWIVGREGTVLRTVDGQTWQRLTPPIREDLVGVDARDALTATVTVGDGRRYETRDGGKTWVALPRSQL